MKIYTDYEMSLAELSEDPVFRKIPANRIYDLISGSMGIGESAADEIIRNQDSTPDPLSICRDKGITVKIIDREYRVGSIHFRSELMPGKKIINILKPSIADMHRQLELVAASIPSLRISEKLIIDIHLAHELYHMLETMTGRMTNRCFESVVLFRIFGYEHKSSILKTREIAAHMFCRKLLRLPFHPKNLDYLYLISKNELSEEDLDSYINKLR